MCPEDMWSLSPALQGCWNYVAENCRFGFPMNLQHYQGWCWKNSSQDWN
jgi:hypothetical protein